MRFQFKGLMLLLILILLSGCDYSKNQKIKKPNVVLVYLDDAGYGDIGSYGATGFETPNIDQLASQGMRFTNFYAPQPVCSTSRAGLLTGSYPNRVGFSGALFPYDKTGIHKNELTLAEMFKEQGYNTAAFGKWHLGWQKEFLPLQHGFDEFVGLPYSNDMWPHSNVTGERLTKGKGRAAFPPLPLIEGNKAIDTIASLKDQDKLTTLYTDKAVEFINRKADEPFFIYIPHTMGHIPLGVSKKFRGKSKQGLYGDVMMEIDWSVGEIIKTLKKNKVEDNTIFIFTSDNGPWLSFGNHAGSAGGLREGKLTSYEGGLKVPFIIRWPGKIPEGTVCSQLASGIDILPTLANIIHGKLSDLKIDGVDITPILYGDFKSQPRETFLYYYGKNNLNAVRKGNWKLVLPHTYKSYNALPGNDGNQGERPKISIEKPELYNIMRDPGERFNVIDANPEKVKEIMVEVEKARKELGDLNVGITKGIGNREIGKLENSHK